MMICHQILIFICLIWISSSAQTDLDAIIFPDQVQARLAELRDNNHNHNSQRPSVGQFDTQAPYSQPYYHSYNIPQAPNPWQGGGDAQANANSQATEGNFQTNAQANAQANGQSNNGFYCPPYCSLLGSSASSASASSGIVNGVPVAAASAAAAAANPQTGLSNAIASATSSGNTQQYDYPWQNQAKR